MNVPIIIGFALAFFAILILIGFVTKKWAQEASDFSLAGREVGMVISISGIMAIAFAGTSLSLAPNFAIAYGFLGSLAFGGVLAAGFAVYGIVYGRMLRRCGSRTLSEWMETRYNGRVRTVTSVGAIIGLCGIMANNIASFASSLTVYTKIPTWVSIAICFGVIVLFTFFSGMHAVNMTNLFQMLIGAIALPLFAFLLAGKFGGVHFITENWPAAGSWVTAGFTGNSLPLWTLKYPSLLSFIILFGVFLIWGSNYYYIRVVSCRSEKVSKYSFVLAAAFKMLVVYIPLAFVGLYAVAANPTSFAPVGTIAGVAAYGFMLFNLAAAVAAFMLIASMAASLSTASTALMGATTTAARDVYQRNFNPNASEKQMLAPSRVIMVLLGILTCILCFFPGGPTYLFAFANAWMGPPAVLLFLGAFWRRFTPAAAFWSVVTGMAVMAAFVVLEYSGIFVIGAYMHLAAAGLISTLVVAILVTIFTKPKYYGVSDWNIDPDTGKREEIKLEKADLQILGLIRSGLNTMVEICDFLGIDSRFTGASVERLDRGGYIRRDGLTGANFYSFALTKRGDSALPLQTEEEKALSAFNLTPMYVSYLKALNKSEDAGIAVLKNNGYTALQVVAVNSMLEHNGFVGQKGQLRRHYFITEKGQKLLSGFSQSKTDAKA